MGTVLRHCCFSEQPSGTNNLPIPFTKKQSKSQENSEKQQLLKKDKQQSQIDKKPKLLVLDKNPVERSKTQNYQSRRLFGKGVFGTAVVVEQKTTKKFYVMKAIEKDKLQKNILLQSSIIEKLSENSFFVNIKETFQNEGKIYVIMQYLDKRDLMYYKYYLQKTKIDFDQQLIRDIVAEVIIALQILHSYNVVYRQLKPQNILLTFEGHIKLNDYFISKLLIKQQPFLSFIGIQEYMAPEVLSGKYDTKLDIWSLGIMIFQLRFGVVPFPTVENISLEQSINSINVQQTLLTKKRQMSAQLFQLLSRLLVKDPINRIAFKQIKELPFFKGIEWDKVKRRENKPHSLLQKDNSVRKFEQPTKQSRRKYVNIPNKKQQDQQQIKQKKSGNQKQYNLHFFSHSQQQQQQPHKQ